MSQRHLKTHSDIPQQYHLSSYKRQKNSKKKGGKPLKEYSKQVTKIVMKLTPQRPQVKNRTRNIQSKLESIREQRMIPKRHTQSFINVSTQKETIGITRRKKSTKGLSYKIKDKTQDFKVVSNCLREYVKQQKKKNQKPQYQHVFKFIKAFNKSQIGSISKPLESLIDEILNTIQQNMIDIKDSKSKLQKFQEPKLGNINYEKNQTTTKKKPIFEQYRQRNNTQIILSNDIQIMNRELQNLRKQQNRLRNLKQIISDKNNDKNVHKQEITNLQKILKRQQVIIQELDNKNFDNRQSQSVHSDGKNSQNS